MAWNVIGVPVGESPPFRAAPHSIGECPTAIATAYGKCSESSFGFRRIIGRLDARNTASEWVLERLGMRREAHFVENEFVGGE